ncbi:MAG: hypothetical protein KR126chlam1_01513 [Chlamydiae bacterium]|nr:hypothetical protein [Chlamydiota bacterium]
MTNRILPVETLGQTNEATLLPHRSSMSRICLQTAFDAAKYYSLFASRVALITPNPPKAFWMADITGNPLDMNDAYGCIKAPSMSLQTNPLEEAALKEKDGHLWECINRSSGEHGGYIYTFRLRDEYNLELAGNQTQRYEIRDAINQKKSEIFPAVEAPGPFFWNSPKHVFWNSPKYEKGRMINLYKELGYSYEKKDQGECYLSLPDCDALKNAWTKTSLYEAGFLPDFKFAPSEGIASDMDFVKAYLENDVLLSSGVEFVHDHLAHVVNRIALIFDCSENYIENYRKCIDAFNHTINVHYKAILQMQAQKGEFKYYSKFLVAHRVPRISKLLSVAVDSITATRTVFLYKSIANSFYYPRSTDLYVHLSRPPLDRYLFRSHLFYHSEWKKYLGKSTGCSFEDLKASWEGFASLVNRGLTQVATPKTKEKKPSASVGA